jgi:16S rRNA (cytosine1402-N4)-methyltransferase
MSYHTPVLLEECLEGLRISAGGVYVDATFGGGGHARAIVNKLDDKGHLFAFDQDEESRANLWKDHRITFVQSNFRYLREYMSYYHVSGVDGILADLGVSSWQIDQEERGFSYRSQQRLDMRMNQGQSVTAADIIHQYDEVRLVGMFSRHAGVRNARTLASELCKARATIRIADAETLLQVIAPTIRGNRMRYLSQVFQALRIEVNEEDKALEEFLVDSGEVLHESGRLVVISYHSGEDRMVKQYVKGIHQDTEGRSFGFKQITKKPIVPDEEQIKENNRARSALLRIAEKYLIQE